MPFWIVWVSLALAGWLPVNNITIKCGFINHILLMANTVAVVDKIYKYQWWLVYKILKG